MPEKTQPTDLVNQSIPFSYLTVQVAANDASSHSVQLYTDVTGEWLVPGNLQLETDKLFQWQTVVGDTINHQFSLQNQTQFLEVNGRVRYGNVTYSTKMVLLFSSCEALYGYSSPITGKRPNLRGGRRYHPPAWVHCGWRPKQHGGHPIPRD